MRESTIYFTTGFSSGLMIIAAYLAKIGLFSTDPFTQGSFSAMSLSGAVLVMISFQIYRLKQGHVPTLADDPG